MCSKYFPWYVLLQRNFSVQDVVVAKGWHGRIHWRKTHQGLLNLQAALLQQILKWELLTAERLFWGSITTSLTFYWTAPQVSLIGPCHRQGARQSEHFDWFCVAFLGIWFSLAVMWRTCVYSCKFDLPKPSLQDKDFFFFFFFKQPTDSGILDTWALIFLCLAPERAFSQANTSDWDASLILIV